jgi:flagellin
LKINHNIAALNAYNNLSKNMSNTSKTLEKLSSGLRINRAADDAAGLAISEKMRSQIRGLSQADRNILDGVSLVQTAEGGLQSIHNMLQRARELSVQAGNDTLTDSDRQGIQEEIEQLKQGINDTANNTQFNGINLLNLDDDGYFVDKTITKTISTDYTVTVPVTTTETVTWTEEVTEIDEESSIVDLSKASSITIYEQTDRPFPSYEKTYSIDSLESGISWSIDDGEEYEFSLDTENDTVTVKSLPPVSLFNITGIRVNGISGYDEAEIWASTIVGSTGEINNPEQILGNNLLDYPYFGNTTNEEMSLTVNFEAHKKTVTEVTKSEEIETTTDVEKQVTETQVITERVRVKVPGSIILQVGANEKEEFEVDLTDARTTALGIDGIDVVEDAQDAIKKLDEAIKIVSSERSKYGAYQNALEHIHSNVSNAEVNLTSAESRIRDTDMASEMTKFTKNNILNQSAQAMLAQANQLPQGILQLLK